MFASQWYQLRQGGVKVAFERAVLVQQSCQVSAKLLTLFLLGFGGGRYPGDRMSEPSEIILAL